jgi:hypothetical protein
LRPSSCRTREKWNRSRGVVAVAQGEELEDFAGEVLVGVALAVGLVVEPADHRGVAGDHFQQGREPRQPQVQEDPVLTHHPVELAHLHDGGGEMPVPEESHFLFELMVAAHHARDEPGAGGVRVVGAENALVDGLQLGGGPVPIRAIHDRIHRRPGVSAQRPLDAARSGAEARPPPEVRGGIEVPGIRLRRRIGPERFVHP